MNFPNRSAFALHDFFVCGETNGDVAANWKIGNALDQHLRSRIYSQ